MAQAEKMDAVGEKRAARKAQLLAVHKAGDALSTRMSTMPDQPVP